MTDKELITRLRSKRQKGNRFDSLEYDAADRIEALTAKLAETEAEAEMYKRAFAAQSRKLQAVLNIEGVKATLAEIKGKSHE